MAQPAPKLADWSDILASPDGVKAEVIAGELLLMSPRPAPVHGWLQAALSSALFERFAIHPSENDDGGWWILVEPDVALGAHDIVSPDLVGWRRRSVPAFPHEQPIAAAPDWVCEILSPRTARRDRTAKAELYLRAGVGHYWLVDPAARLIEAFAARADGWLRLGAWSSGGAGEHADEPGARIPPFETAAIDVDALFPPAPSPAETD